MQVQDNPPSIRSPFWTHVRTIVWGAILGFAGALTLALAGAIGAFFLPGPVGTPVDVLSLEVSYGVAYVVSPIGFFLVLVGLARAIRREVTQGGRHRVLRTPFQLTVLGAIVGLVGGLLTAAYTFFRIFIGLPTFGGGFKGFVRASAILNLVFTSLSAGGSLLAFLGVAMALRPPPVS